MNLDEARKLAERVAGSLAEYCDQIEIAGSIRRGRPEVNDIDLVVLIKPGQEYPFRRRCIQRCTIVTDGPQNVILRLPASGFQLDLFIARPEAKDLLATTPTNFGSLLLCRTGSRAHNIWLIEHAKKIGLCWNPYHGVYTGRHCIASATEADIFRALQLDFIPPEARER